MAEIEQISINKVLSVLVNSKKIIKPKQSHYDKLEIDKFWTYVGEKDRKVWLKKTLFDFTNARRFFRSVQKVGRF